MCRKRQLDDDNAGPSEVKKKKAAKKKNKTPKKKKTPKTKKTPLKKKQKKADAAPQPRVVRSLSQFLNSQPCARVTDC
jgi:hypothetical protein